MQQGLGSASVILLVEATHHSQHFPTAELAQAPGSGRSACASLHLLVDI